MSSLFAVLPYLIGLGFLVVSLWLMARWLRKRPPIERWLAVPACLPLLGVAEHAWHAGADFEGSDDLLSHFWLAGFQVLLVLGAARWSSVPVGVVARVSRRDNVIGLVATGIACVSMAMFILAYGEHLDMWVAPFPANAPTWWRTIAWHAWGFWLLIGIGLVLSSRAMRRGRAGGYIGLALVVSFVALLHWDTFQATDVDLGASVGSIILITVVCSLSWILAVYRLLARSRFE